MKVKNLRRVDFDGGPGSHRNVISGGGQIIAGRKVETHGAIVNNILYASDTKKLDKDGKVIWIQYEDPIDP